MKILYHSRAKAKQLIRTSLLRHPELLASRNFLSMTEPQFSSAKDDVTPFKVNGDASTLPDQRIPTRTCESSVTFTLPAALYSQSQSVLIPHTWHSTYLNYSLPKLPCRFSLDAHITYGLFPSRHKRQISTLRLSHKFIPRLPGRLVIV